MKEALVGLVGIILLVTGGLAFAPKTDTGNTITLHDYNTVSLNMPIEGSSAKALEKALLEKSDALGKNDVIYLVLNSPGGSVDAGNEIIEVAKGLPQRVDTITLFSASMSFHLSQSLGNRYITSGGTMMSHKAAVGGISGNIPGSAFTRLYYFLEMVTRLDSIAADRAQMNIEQYQNLTANELWMGGEQSVDLKFADKVVAVHCDKSLRGPGAKQHISMFFFTADVQFDKCPLITSPDFVQGDDKAFGYFYGSQVERVRMVTGQ